ncbi:hypothetical protein V7O66_13700 [Methanolobus sp. ZRKC3]|uniref:hypothetical protein n=1 Tax=Methanolobus sp. ZRKC3 TaxID=3125786 RepID=UPI003256099D
MKRNKTMQRTAAQVLATTIVIMAVGLFFIVSILPASADVMTIQPEQGIEFEQVDFLPPAPPVENSDWGRVSIDPEILAEATGITSGYLNIFSDAGWVVQNLPINVDDETSPVVSYFSLGLEVPTDVNLLSAHIEFTPDPQITFGDGERGVFPVGTALWNAAGIGSIEAPQITSASPDMPSAPGGNLVLGNNPNTWHTQPNAVNVEAAINQCFPMAVANSLQYLENRFEINIPNDHQLGLKGDNTLVGQLDTEVDRFAPARNNGGGVWFTPMLEGKFAYLAKNGLEDDLVHKHQGRGWGTPPNQALPDGDFESSGIISKDEGDKVTFEFICDQIKTGEDIELVWQWGDDGGHAVRVFECGTIGGKNWVGYLHDRVQSNDTAGLETVREIVDDFDGDGTLDIGSEDRPIRFVMSESQIETPVPTLTPFGIVILSCLLGILGIIAIRKN